MFKIGDRVKVCKELSLHESDQTPGTIISHVDCDGKVCEPPSNWVAVKWDDGFDDKAGNQFVIDELEYVEDINGDVVP